MSWNVVGINFDHMHVHDLLGHVDDHPDATVVGLCDENRDRSTGDIERAADEFDVDPQRVFDSCETCLAETRPDIAVLCPATTAHADWVERVAEHDVHVVLEKPFATTLSEADRIIRAVEATGNRLAINWPLAWYPPHRTTKRLVDEGTVGEVTEIHYYDGNSGPARDSWFYDSEAGGGSLLDYLGYGATLGTWFRDGEMPSEVTTTAHSSTEADVDEQSVTVARYRDGLSTFQTRLGTFTDPWEHQPQPKCGFVVVGTEGTISSYDYAETVRVQTEADPGGREIPVDELEPPNRNPIEYVIHCIEHDRPIEGPLSPTMSRKGQRIVDAARRSIDTQTTVTVADRNRSGV
ncbi:Gfo/Idh/MocA family protein [Halorussus salinisoli]|uniref:Gfo/Idh/MocA family protein n=1 Tax=Halorussus salinisoli TaxID=2558242 RepID=UPI002A909ABD|nr:Gfo/Idh/MocA family oxidoreductase [Halorussus salinisoli]